LESILQNTNSNDQNIADKRLKDAAMHEVRFEIRIDASKYVFEAYSVPSDPPARFGRNREYKERKQKERKEKKRDGECARVPFGRSH